MGIRVRFGGIFWWRDLVGLGLWALAREREETAQGEKKEDGAQQIKGTDAIIRERIISRKGD